VHAGEPVVHAGERILHDVLGVAGAVRQEMGETAGAGIGAAVERGEVAAVGLLVGVTGKRSE
jgi:hypothetical protein